VTFGLVPTSALQFDSKSLSAVRIAVLEQVLFVAGEQRFPNASVTSAAVALEPGANDCVALVTAFRQGERLVPVLKPFKKVAHPDEMSVGTSGLAVEVDDAVVVED